MDTNFKLENYTFIGKCDGFNILICKQYKQIIEAIEDQTFAISQTTGFSQNADIVQNTETIIEILVRLVNDNNFDDVKEIMLNFSIDGTEQAIEKIFNEYHTSTNGLMQMFNFFMHKNNTAPVSGPNIGINNFKLTTFIEIKITGGVMSAHSFIECQTFEPVGALMITFNFMDGIAINTTNELQNPIISDDMYLSCYHGLTKEEQFKYIIENTLKNGNVYWSIRENFKKILIKDDKFLEDTILLFNTLASYASNTPVSYSIRKKTINNIKQCFLCVDDTAIDAILSGTKILTTRLQQNANVTINQMRLIVNALASVDTMDVSIESEYMRTFSSQDSTSFYIDIPLYCKCIFSSISILSVLANRSSNLTPVVQKFYSIRPATTEYQSSPLRPNLYDNLLHCPSDYSSWHTNAIL